MLDTMISRITDVKYTELIMPSLSPLCATIKATSPRVADAYLERVLALEAAEP